MNKSPLKTLKKTASLGDKPSTMVAPTPRTRTSSDGSPLLLASYDSGDEEEIDSGLGGLTASMYKRRGGFGRKADNNWIKRTVTLERGIISYYEEEDLKKPRGRLNLNKEDTVAEMQAKKTDAPTEFLLTVNIYLFRGGKRKWEFSCADQDQQLKWYSAIRQFDGKAKSYNKGLDDNSYGALPVHNKDNNGIGLRHRNLGSTGSLSDLDQLTSKTTTTTTTLFTKDVLILFGIVNATAYFIKIATELTHILIAFLVLNLLAFLLLLKTAVNTTPQQVTHDKLNNDSTEQQSLISKNVERGYTFNDIVPAGTTLKRAPIKKGSSLEEIIQKHGESSIEAIRAYAASSESDYDATATHCYWNMKSTEFKLRVGPNYKKNKLKEPSAEALYEVVSVDFVRSNAVLQNSKDAFKPPVIPGLTDIPSTGHPHIPPMFVVNAWLPSEEPSLLRKTQDGMTYVCVIHYAITQKTLDQLKDFENASPAVKLFAQWCEKAENDFDLRSRLKFMGAVVDIEQLGLPSFISSQNGRPCLITKSGTFTRHSNYIEMSINVRAWAYLAKKALHILQPKFPKFVLNIGITIEGRKDEELPEILLGGCRLIRIDPDRAATENTIC